MKKIVAIVGAGVAGAIAISTSFAGNNNISSELRVSGESALDNIVNQMASKQEQYIKDHGTYWQGLSTHDFVPSKNEALNPDRKPSDVDKSWKDMGFILGKNSRFLLKTDVYDGPDGNGYTITIRTIENGKLFEKVLNFGNETYRAHDWTYIPPLK